MTDVEDQSSLLETMSAEDKDALIARLWRDLQTERARSTELERRLAPKPAGPGSPERDRDPSPILKRLRQAAGKRAAGSSVSSTAFGSGRRLAFLRSKALIAAATIVALAFAVDFAVGQISAASSRAETTGRPRAPARRL